MTTLTYASLLADVQVYAERSDNPFVSQIPRFVMLAENRIASEIANLGMVRAVTLTLNGNVIGKPVRWRKTKNLAIYVDGERKTLFPRSYEYCREYWPDASETGEPEFFSDYDQDHVLIVGTPDQNYPAEWQYYERPEPLSDSNQTNWTTEYAPQLLLYATLLEAQPFLKNAERAKEFQALYDRAAEALGKEDSSRIEDSSTRR